MLKRITLISTGLCVSAAAIAEYRDDWSIWLSNTYQTDFGGSSYLAFLELAPRTRNDNGEFSQIIARPLLGYKITPKFQIWAGYTWQGEYSKQHDFNRATHDAMQQLQWADNWTPQLDFQYRFRLEQRFFADEASVGHRMRHRVRWIYSLTDSQAYLIAADELFIHLNAFDDGPRAHSVQTGINQNRSYIGVGYRVTPKMNVDTGYQLQYVNNFGVPDLLNHIWMTHFNFNF
ncbi:MAG: DUF2490 domain-containing protein [Methylomonas sp.]|nr:DUF2490 domain-containing protein [Methylomonas sp.]PPD20795.1 MAG: hypothetical protein CTY23_07610 [Methylomonas sp.]PPD27282.1 MAG: hypothetical protein CTY22_02350 [Methylomonas sp.]PPD39253.1 MAG: hypothetical protein CTY21_02345 [Methylomonas sp.]PPD40749.1 MAG: hypothetical protein CTY17_05620 [Methylomonas sp.]